MFEWDKNKSLEILRRHGFDFVQIENAILEDSVIIDVPNKSRKQKGFLVFLNDYPIIVPFEIRNQKYRLITAWPDRRFKNE